MKWTTLTKVPDQLSATDLAPIHAALCGYQWWISQGKPQYGKEQWRYDNTRRYISERPDGTFYFSIQLRDSPEGDAWLRGYFRAVYDYPYIEVLEARVDSY